MPIHRRMPKRGFNNKTFRDRVAIVNLCGLERKFEADTVINEAALREAGLIKGAWEAVKILGNGTLTKALTVEGLRCSASARTKIEEAGGSVRAPAGTE